MLLTLSNYCYVVHARLFTPELESNRDFCWNPNQIVSLSWACPHFPLRCLLLVLCFLRWRWRWRTPVTSPCRAILKLRNMREEYAVALRQQHEGNAPPLSMFRSQVQTTHV